jgi:hypothetical protein
MLRYHRRMPFALPILGVLVLFSPPSGRACAVCLSLNNPLALPHPRAIEIAVATRTAIDKGLLPPEKLITAATVLANGTGFIALKRVSAAELVKTWVARLKPRGQRSEPLIVHFLFVDTEEACGVEFRGGLVQYQPRLSSRSDARVVTTRMAFHALLTGRLTAGEARKRGLICLEGTVQSTAFSLEMLPWEGAAAMPVP